jgi:hypothetical protein
VDPPAVDVLKKNVVNTVQASDALPARIRLQS